MKIATAKNLSVLVLISTSLLGCSVLNTAGESAFSCPGLPQGITCKTPTAVFNSSNGALPVAESDLPMQGTAAFNAMNAQVPEISVVGVNDGAYSQGDVRTPLPVRSRAQVMRIWIAPWIDKNDDLHLPSFLYTEVQTRTWNLGEAEFVGNGVAVPYRAMDIARGKVKSTKGSDVAQNNPSDSALRSPQPPNDLNLGD